MDAGSDPPVLMACACFKHSAEEIKEAQWAMEKTLLFELNEELFYTRISKNKGLY